MRQVGNLVAYFWKDKRPIFMILTKASPKMDTASLAQKLALQKRRSHSQSFSTTLIFKCSRPVELHLQPGLSLNPNLPPCPVPHELNLPMPVHYNKDLDLLVTVTDSSGRRFDNFSSLDLSWTVSPPHLGELIQPRGELRTDIQVEASGRKVLSNYQTLRPHKEQGSIIIQASIERYKSYVFTKLSKKPQENITPVISKSLELLLVQEAELSPSTLSVFNHPSNQVTINIQHGSGYFHVEDFESQVITALHDRKNRGIQVKLSAFFIFHFF
ncbi:nuclear pore membrane glycoprotein 210-like [Elysia marginata]|uniref:Nuclear pore membrane glycoprotein 210-like n=1 Tax=Elysia marginata TaxID=1093978 RepID=A0AAV4IBX6_9GAST|nr:nuclear pore membrane glycoprotein 210-like [Elysia marginata]